MRLFNRTAKIFLMVALSARMASALCDVSGSTYTYTATNQADLLDCFSKATHTGDVVHLSGAGFPVTAQLPWTAPSNATFYGDGAKSWDLENSTTTGSDVTTLTDNFVSAQPYVLMVLPDTGTFRMYGIAFIGGSGTSSKFNGIYQSYGLNKNFRVDHCHFDNTTYTSPSTPVFIQLYGYLNGVIDHNYFVPYRNTNAVKVSYAGADAYGEGDTVWASSTSLGGSDFVFMESNGIATPPSDGMTARSSVFDDTDHGGKIVVRYNTAPFGSFQTHPTGGAGTARGGRAFEFYGNNFNANDPPLANFNNGFISAGTGVIWGNSSTPAAGDHFLSFHSDRRHDAANGGTYTEYPPVASFGGLGYCGPAYSSGIVNTTNGKDVIRTGGTNFSTSWPTNSMIILDNGITYTSYAISSVTSTSLLTLKTSTIAVTGLTYTIGSNMDANTDVNLGYICADAPGTGKSDLLIGTYPNKMNHSRGDAGPLSPTFGIRSALEPIYEWNDTYLCSGCSHGDFLLNNDPDVLIADRDYYLYTATFNGTSGVGSGHRAARPASTTNGVAYWSDDAGGNWYTTNASANDGCLDIVQSGAWVNCVYTPYQYPHPLAGGGGGGGGSSGPPFVAKGKFTLKASARIK